MQPRVLDLESADKPRATGALRVAEVELQYNLSDEDEVLALAGRIENSKALFASGKRHDVK